MKVKIVEAGQALQFKVIAQEGVTDETLQSMYYTLSDGVYTREYPRQALMFPQDLAQMERNYNAYLSCELHQENRSTLDLDAALTWVCHECARRGIRWWLAGSAALYVRGLAVKPHDLDVMTFMSEISLLQEMVAPYIVEPFHHVTGWVVQGFGVVDYRYRIDFAFDPEAWVDGQGPVDFGPYAQEHCESVCWHGYEILVPPLELHLASNQARGRQERVDLILRSLGR